MLLDRNDDQTNGRGKYALLKLRELERVRQNGPFGELDGEVVAALKLLEQEGILDWGEANTEREFFVIRLRDKYAGEALLAYAAAAAFDGDKEFSDEVLALSNRAGLRSKYCKRPD